MKYMLIPFLIIHSWNIAQELDTLTFDLSLESISNKYSIKKLKKNIPPTYKLIKETKFELNFETPFGNELNFGIAKGKVYSSLFTESKNVSWQIIKRIKDHEFVDSGECRNTNHQFCFWDLKKEISILYNNEVNSSGLFVVISRE